MRGAFIFARAGKQGAPLMQWRAPGVVLGVRQYGEQSAIVDIFTQDHGRVAGLVRGAKGRRMRSLLQPGQGVWAQWRARLVEHLGSYTLEPNNDIGTHALSLSHRVSLLGVQNLCLLLRLLPERAPHERLFDASCRLLRYFAQLEDWPSQFIRTELLVLDDMGFGLDLSRCVVTGARCPLVYISPRSGCAVSAEGAGAYAPRLLPLPSFLLTKEPPSHQVSKTELEQGFAITTHFLEKRVFASSRHDIPASRADMIRLLLA